VISLAVAAAGWVLLVTRRLRRYPISTTFETPPSRLVQFGNATPRGWYNCGGCWFFNRRYSKERYRAARRHI
jgi:hypothetical protein